MGVWTCFFVSITPCFFAASSPPVKFYIYRCTSNREMCSEADLLTNWGLCMYAWGLGVGGWDERKRWWIHGITAGTVILTLQYNQDEMLISILSEMQTIQFIMSYARFEGWVCDQVEQPSILMSFYCPPRACPYRETTHSTPPTTTTTTTNIYSSSLEFAGLVAQAFKPATGWLEL